MENRMSDRLAAVVTDLTGVSQLMMTVYEDERRNGIDAERMLILRDVVEWCREEIGNLKRELDEESWQ